MSLTGAYDEQNIFAKMLRGEVPRHSVFEDETALAFLDIFPQTRGHTLVVPTIPARNFLEFPADHLGDYMTRVHRVAHAVRSALEPDGLTLIQFNGAPAGQTVFHLHFHIIPTYAGVAAAGHGQAARADDVELAGLASAIANAL